MANVLVIAPDALGEVFGCGATGASHCDMGDAVEALVFFGDGTGLDAKRRVAASEAAILGTAAPRFSYEILSSTDWHRRRRVCRSRLPTLSTLQRKMRALRAYGAEMRPQPHSRSPQAVKSLARSRGHSVGLAAAEAFTVVRQIIGRV
jgi:hypothetical protein